MKKLFITLTITLLALVLITGCEKDTSSALSDQELAQTTIQESLSSDENVYMIDWAIDDGSENNMYNGFSSFGKTGFSLDKVLSPEDQLVRFGRIIKRRYPRQITIRPLSPDSILVNVDRVLVGNFISILAPGDTVQRDSFLVYRKPMRHLVSRTTLFVKNNNEEDVSRDPRRRWKMAGVSLSKGVSRPENTVQIHKLIIVSENGDTLKFSAPLHTMLNIPDDIPTFVTGEQVKVIALVSNSSANLVPDPETGATETVLLHYGVNRQHHARKRFEYRGIDPATGYAIFEGAWTIHEPANHVFHAAVDVIDNGTIYEGDEQTYPYNSVTWGCPYRVVLSK